MASETALASPNSTLLLLLSNSQQNSLCYSSTTATLHLLNTGRSAVCIELSTCHSEKCSRLIPYSSYSLKNVASTTVHYEALQLQIAVQASTLLCTIVLRFAVLSTRSTMLDRRLFSVLCLITTFLLEDNSLAELQWHGFSSLIRHKMENEMVFVVVVQFRL